MLDLLKKHFGYDTFRPLQEEIVTRCVSGQDALVLMPTGGGKSLCYQLPALRFPGITLVISPLIALMKDQVDALRANGIPAAFINSSLSAQEIREIEQQARDKQLKLLYLAPERLANPSVLHFLQQLDVSLIAVDEAHCISEWGHDFRPDYRNLHTLREDLPGVPMLALTATANIRVRNDIISQLKLEQGRVFQSSFNRPNLVYRVLPKKQSFEYLLSEVKSRLGQAIIVYCFSRKSTEKITADLKASGLPAAAYHAGLSAEERSRVQEAFIRDRVSIIVATIAFGMGIDKPDVRLVVHMDLPKSVEGYYQETGRAGRDGLPSDCLLFFSKGDCFKQELFIREMTDLKERTQARKQLQQMTQYGELTTCRRAFLLNYFGESWTQTNCNGCDICLPQLKNVTPLSRKQSSSGATAIEFDQTLFEELRLKRRDLADARGVPPYVIFGDRTLQEMAHWYPQSLDSLSRIFGVGKEKLAQYGQIFLDVICPYARAKGLTEKTMPATTSVETPVTRAPSGTMFVTLELFKQKKPLKQIAESRNITLGTVLTHLEQALEQNIPLDTSHLGFSSPERLEQIVNGFKAANTQLLGPVRIRLGNTFSFEEIRFVRFLMRARGSAFVDSFKKVS